MPKLHFPGPLLQKSTMDSNFTISPSFDNLNSLFIWLSITEVHI